MQDNMIHNYPYAFGYLKSRMRMAAENLAAKGLIREKNIEAVQKFINDEINRCLENERKYSKEERERRLKGTLV